MLGSELFDGAHFDEWVVDYGEYRPGKPDAVVFDTPDLCRDKQPAAPLAASGRSAAGTRMAMLAPAVHYRGGDAVYDAFLAAYASGRRRHGSLEEYHTRAQLHARNVAAISAHNAAAEQHGYTLAINRFADWSDEEFLSLMLPRKAARRQQQLLQQQGGKGRDEAAARKQEDGGKVSPATANGIPSSSAPREPGLSPEAERPLAPHELPYEPHVQPERLPASVSWRGTGAAGRVGPKDQANCGSCWVSGIERWPGWCRRSGSGQAAWGVLLCAFWWHPCGV
jgi:hypothetical protein